jgi:hypothetical protein
VPRRLQKFALFAALGILPGSGALHASGVYALLSEARVAGDAIYLSDLLPTQASPELRMAAAKIRLGSAPRPGGSLTLDANAIDAVAIPITTRREFSVPPQIVVHRFARVVTQDEVVAALNAALKANSFPGNPVIDGNEVHYSAQVKVAADDALLHVRRVDFDASIQEARFLVVTGADPRALPFLVTARLKSVADNSHVGNATASIMSAGMAAGAVSGLAGDPLHSSAQPDPADVLIAKGKPVRLRIASGSMQMIVDVVALEPGVLHQTIQVRVPGSGRVLRGQVVAPGHLEAQF